MPEKVREAHLGPVLRAAGRYAALALLVAAAAGRASGAATAYSGDVLFASPTQRDHIGRILAPVVIDGKGPYRFIIDTGASQSTMSPALAVKLGLSPAKDASVVVNGVTGSAPEPTVPVRLLQAGALQVLRVRIPIIVTPMLNDADGILGVAGLTHSCLFVDFRANRVAISRCGLFTPPSRGQRISAVRLEGGLIAVYVRVGPLRVPAIIDTGAQRTMGNLALRDALSAQRTEADPILTPVYGATAAVATGQLTAAPPIVIGPDVISGADIVFGDFHIFQVWHLDRRPAMIIGMDVLGRVDGLGIDFEHPQLYIQTAPDVPTGWSH